MLEEIRISGIIEESIVDGVGIRFVVFTQGCVHACVGCHNQGTHSMSGGYIIKIDEIVEKIKNNPLVSGITISGGEPFLQPFSVYNLISKIVELNKNVWIYSGYTFEELLENENSEINEKILEKTKILVDGRFILEQRDLRLKFRGSRNQRLIDCKKTFKAGKIVLLNR